jgi:hypothetical protein
MQLDLKLQDAKHRSTLARKRLQHLRSVNSASFGANIFVLSAYRPTPSLKQHIAALHK